MCNISYMNFMGAECFEMHKENTCNYHWRRLSCRRTYETKNRNKVDHVCGEH